PRPAELKANQVFARSSRYCPASAFFQSAGLSSAKTGTLAPSMAGARRRRTLRNEVTRIAEAPELRFPPLGPAEKPRLDNRLQPQYSMKTTPPFPSDVVKPSEK